MPLSSRKQQVYTYAELFVFLVVVEVLQECK